ncbi:MAG: hypothetical protein RLZZ164_312 [Actinomycetota bacterium]|jgi:heme/copper-type cytochrome/quinol oxidase subunit 2
MIKHLAAEVGGIELPFPAPVFGAIALTVFVLLGFITWSYRDVANRHDHKVDGDKAHH